MRSSDIPPPRLAGAWRRTVRTTLLTFGCAVVAGTASGQDDGGRAGREREALRRTQAALRQSQESATALAKDKADLAAQRDQSSETAKRAQAQLAAQRSDGAQLQAKLVQLQTEAAAARTLADAQAKEAQAKTDALALRLVQSEQVVQERTRANASLTALLEFASKSLASAEKANRDMYALGRQMIDQLRSRQPVPGTTVVDPVLGFDSIRIENHAEALRDQLDAAKLPATASR